MFSCSGRKILLGVVTGTLLSTAVTTVVTADDKTTHYLLDSQDQPVMTTRPEECVITPRTPNTPNKLFKKCGDIGDRDKDGIMDDDDVCPDNTPGEISKGVYQDGPRRGCPVDTDNDSVADYRDNCPENSTLEISKGVYDDAIPPGRPINLPPEIAKDLVGCPLDSDHDCVENYRDKCPNSEQKANLCALVNESGCLPRDVIQSLDDTGEALFAFDSAKLTPRGMNAIDGIINQYRSDFEAGRITNVEVVGHTDPLGTQQYNQKLSEKRAASVVKYSVENGVPADLISSRGVGELELVERNDYESDKEWRSRCRRVVVTITKY